MCRRRDARVALNCNEYVHTRRKQHYIKGMVYNMACVDVQWTSGHTVKKNNIGRIKRGSTFQFWGGTIHCTRIHLNCFFFSADTIGHASISNSPCLGTPCAIASQGRILQGCTFYIYFEVYCFLWETICSDRSNDYVFLVNNFSQTISAERTNYYRQRIYFDYIQCYKLGVVIQQSSRGVGRNRTINKVPAAFTY